MQRNIAQADAPPRDSGNRHHAITKFPGESFNATAKWPA
jgi:hypothetical protein